MNIGTMKRKSAIRGQVISLVMRELAKMERIPVTESEWKILFELKEDLLEGRLY